MCALHETGLLVFENPICTLRAKDYHFLYKHMWHKWSLPYNLSPIANVEGHKRITSPWDGNIDDSFRTAHPLTKSRFVKVILMHTCTPLLNLEIDCSRSQ